MTNVKELKDLLKWAKDNMTYIERETEETVEWCPVCNNPGWNHKPDCEGKAWTKRVREILSSEDG